MITYADRFHGAMVALCGASPGVITRQLCDDWLSHRSEELQDAVFDTPIAKRLNWIQGIALIDAAQTLAQQPEEGRDDIEY